MLSKSSNIFLAIEYFCDLVSEMFTVVNLCVTLAYFQCCRTPRGPSHMFYWRVVAWWQGGGGGVRAREFFWSEIFAKRDILGSMKDAVFWG